MSPLVPTRLRPDGLESAHWGHRFALAYDDARRGRLAAAVEGYHRTIALAPERHEAWYNLGAVFVRLGRLRDAVVAYHAALERAPEDPEIWNNLGNALAGLGRGPASIRCYQRALGLSPHYDVAWNNLGVALDLADDPGGACAALARALDAEPRRTTYLLNRASALARAGRWTEASEHLRRAFQVESELRLLVSCLPEFGRLRREPR